METKRTSTETHDPSGIEQHLASETELWAARDRDPRAREELMERYLPFARSLASRYRGANESFDDLVQVASVGLVNAVNRFDPDKGTPFAAFASPTILGELKRYFRDRVWMVRVPRGLQENIRTVETASSDLGAELHRTPTTEEIAEHAGMEEAEVDEVMVARQERSPVSLDQPEDEEGRTPEDRVGVSDPNYGLVEDKDEIREAMSDLSSVEKRVLRLRFIEDMTQSEIADRIGYSQMHVSRLLRRSLERLEEKTAVQ
ncbi:MAG TPA: SigB/SigF/SigG family RNA polymerase sigma factor [Solirubrobacterales bacterium]|nr:SigB/SigF/SigG family RNA polymerase sigma factor [Solirubrobacterales bacterium]